MTTTHEQQTHAQAEMDSDRCRLRRLDMSGRLELCSYDELRVLDVILARLELGRERYGYLDLSRDRRDFKRERAEEYVDAAIYDACDALDRAAAAVAEAEPAPLPPAPLVDGPHALIDLADTEPTRG